MGRDVWGNGLRMEIVGGRVGGGKNVVRFLCYHTYIQEIGRWYLFLKIHYLDIKVVLILYLYSGDRKVVSG